MSQDINTAWQEFDRETFLPKARLTLGERFVVPPFSVLDARQGYWQERKRQWLSLGIQSERGRGAGLLGFSEQAEDFRQGKGNYAKRNAAPGGSPRPAASLGPDGHTVRGDGHGRGLARSYGQDPMKGENPNFGRRLTWVAGDRPLDDLDETSRKILAGGRLRRAFHDAGDKARALMPETAAVIDSASGTSIFDPVLCELAYRWFCPPTGHILDPFAGGSVRGIVASLLGRRYTGIDLSIDQIEANRQQAGAIIPEAEPEWIEGDSRGVLDTIPGGYDFIFSCPPYGDLEVYTNNPSDLSCMEWPEFLSAYRDIIARSVSLLKPDRFACFVVGDFRDGKGFYRNFVSETIGAFEAAGARLYNEAVLITQCGSLPIRAGKQFEASRKLGKTHQNVLVFVKGDPRKAAEACGKIKVAGIEQKQGVGQ